VRDDNGTFANDNPNRLSLIVTHGKFGAHVPDRRGSSVHDKWDAVVMNDAEKCLALEVYLALSSSRNHDARIRTEDDDAAVSQASRVALSDAGREGNRGNGRRAGPRRLPPHEKTGGEQQSCRRGESPDTPRNCAGPRPDACLHPEQCGLHVDGRRRRGASLRSGIKRGYEIRVAGVGFEPMAHHGCLLGRRFAGEIATDRLQRIKTRLSQWLEKAPDEASSEIGG